MIDYKELYDCLFHVSKQAGELALKLQNGIVNEGKQVEAIIGEDLRHKAMREAKTKADEMVQELFLAALKEKYGTLLSLDVEEETELVKAFSNTSYDISFILDPIDGTLEYLEQKDSYSICSAIISQGDVKLAIVYFPAKDVLYGYCEGMPPKEYHRLMDMQPCMGKELCGKRQEHAPFTVYKNARLSEQYIEKLHEKGYIVLDDQEEERNCPQVLLECLYGRALACFCDTRNIRDILLGAILSKTIHGGAYDYSGNRLIWQSFGRQKEAVFSIYPKELLFPL